MSKIIKLEGTEVYIGMDDQKIVKAPISAVNYPNPQVGDEIRIFKDGDTTCRFVKHMLHHQARNHLKQFEEISIPAGA